MTSMSSDVGQAILQIFSLPNGFVASIPDISLGHDMLIPIVISETNIEKIQKSISKHIENITKQSTLPAGEQQNDISLSYDSRILAEFKEIGLEIYKDTNIKGAFDFLFNNRGDIRSLKIVTDVAHDAIPWDLTFMIDSDRIDEDVVAGSFLCEEFSCGISILDNNKFKSNEPISFQRNEDVAEDDVFLIYGHNCDKPILNHDKSIRNHRYLRFLSQDCDSIADLAGKYFNGKTINLANKNRNVFLEKWESISEKCKILYIQGHFDNGKLYTPDGYLDANQIIDWMGKGVRTSKQLSKGPIVFLNGCTTTFGSIRNSSYLTSNIHLAQALVECGASACILTRGPVYEGPASLFAQEFFNNLLVRQNSIGESVFQARCSLKKGDSIYQTSSLFYTLYGDPTQRLWYHDKEIPTVVQQRVSLHSVLDIDASDYYSSHDFNPDDNFNRIEPTLSHIFRHQTGVLGGKNFSDVFCDWLETEDVSSDKIIEIGVGLGDVAKNLIEARKRSKRNIKEYQMVDISPVLIGQAYDKLISPSKDNNIIFQLRDARNLPYVDNSVDSLVLSIGMIADLHSVLVDLSRKQPAITIHHRFLTTYLSLLDQHMSKFKEADGDYYLHLGAFDFIRELSRIMKKGALAIVAEYHYTPKNAVADFENHRECGIHFEAMEIISIHFGFSVKICDVTEILGIDLSTQFLSIDFFTQKNVFLIQYPELDPLFRVGGGLPVGAYTRPSLRKVLSESPYQLSESSISVIMGVLEPYFNSIIEPDFDSLHPETWHYKFMLLEKI